MLDTHTFIINWLMPFAALVMAGCGVYLTAKLSGWIDVHAGWLSTDQKAKLLALEQDAYKQAVNWILNQVQAKGEKVQIQPNNWLVRQGVQIVLDHPASVLGSPEDVAAKIVAMLPAAAVATGPIVTVTPVETKPLDLIAGAKS